MGNGNQGRPKAPNPVDIEVGARIRTRRRIVGMSQGKLADALGVTFQQVQKYEKGTNRVGASRLQNVANVLGVPVSYFFDEQVATIDHDRLRVESHNGSELIRFLETTEGRDLNIAFAKIQVTALRKCVVGLVKAIADVDSNETDTVRR